MAILDKNEITKSLMNYYITNFGELETDEWYEQPAVNVLVFKRDNKIITIKLNIKNGEIEVGTEYFLDKEKRGVYSDFGIS